MEKVPERGFSYSNIRDRFFDTIDATDENHIIVLDEIDHLDGVNELLYDITRARSNEHLIDAHIVVIGISNNYRFRSQLSPKVQSSFQEDEIRFSTYNADELRGILEERAKLAFYHDTYDDSALALAAAVASKDTGSARQAIDLLRKGGEIAEREVTSTPYITESDIKKAREEVKRGRLSDKISDQPAHTRLALEAIAHLDLHNKTPVKSKVIKKSYEETAEKYGEEPLTTLEGLRNHLSDLVMLGFLTQEEDNQGRAGGRSNVYSLNMDSSVVIELCEEIQAQMI